jgi:hypothetical protein
MRSEVGFRGRALTWPCGGACRHAARVSEGVLLRGGERLGGAHAGRLLGPPGGVPPASAERRGARVGAQGALAVAVAHPARLPGGGAPAGPPHAPPAPAPLRGARGAIPGSLLLGQLLGHQVQKPISTISTISSMQSPW